jgi:hypothetical protein
VIEQVFRDERARVLATLIGVRGAIEHAGVAH